MKAVFKFWVHKSLKSPVWLAVLGILLTAVVLLTLRTNQTQQAIIVQWDQGITADSSQITSAAAALKKQSGKHPTPASANQLKLLYPIGDDLDAQSTALFNRDGKAYMQTFIQTYQAALAYQKRYGGWLLHESPAALKPKARLYQLKLRRHELLEPLDASSVFPNNFLMVLRLFFAGPGALAAAALICLQLVLNRVSPDRSVWALASAHRRQVALYQLLTTLILMFLSLAFAFAGSFFCARFLGHPFLPAAAAHSSWTSLFSEIPQTLGVAVVGRIIGFAGFVLLISSALQVVLWRSFHPLLAAGAFGGMIGIWTLTTLKLSLLQKLWNPAAWLVIMPTGSTIVFSAAGSLLLAVWLAGRFDAGKAVLS